MKGSTLYEEIALAAEGLLGVARRPGRGPNAGMLAVELEERFRYAAFAPKDYAARSEELDTLFQGVADLRPVSLMYPGPSGSFEQLTVHPYALLLYKESIFALARDLVRDEVRAFELEYIRAARTLDDERFELPSSFRVEEYLQGQFGLWRSSGETTNAVIDFDARIAAQVTTRTFHPSQRVEPLPNGGARMHLALGDVSEFTAWALGFGPLAVVREPAALRNQVASALESALENYRASTEAATSKAVASKPATPKAAATEAGSKSRKKTIRRGNG